MVGTLLCEIFVRHLNEIRLSLSSPQKEERTESSAKCVSTPMHVHYTVVTMPIPSAYATCHSLSCLRRLVDLTMPTLHILVANKWRSYSHTCLALQSAHASVHPSYHLRLCSFTQPILCNILYMRLCNMHSIIHIIAFYIPSQGMLSTYYSYLHSLRRNIESYT